MLFTENSEPTKTDHERDKWSIYKSLSLEQQTNDQYKKRKLNFYYLQMDQNGSFLMWL